MEDKYKKNFFNEELHDALVKVDKIIMKKYISDIDKRPIFIPSDAINVIGKKVRLSKLTRVVFDKEESVLDKLTATYCATALYESATLVMLLKSDGNNIDVYVGTVSKKSDDPFVPKKQIQALIQNFEANFPGSKMEEIETPEKCDEIFGAVFDKELCVSVVTGVAALKHDEQAENSKYVQGLEKIADSLRGKVCSVLIIADPVGEHEKQSIRAGYEELYSVLKPFEKSEYSINKNTGKSITDSLIKGVTNTTSESLAKTKTHTRTQGTSSSKTVGGSVGINANVPLVNVNASMDYHSMKGQHEDISKAKGLSKTSGISRSLTEQNSIATSLSSSEGEGFQVTYENRSIKSIIEKIDLQIERIVECDDYGMFDCGVYFLSDDYTTCLSVASTYKSIVQGEHSSVESSHISIWDEKDSKELIPYLRTFHHPVFDLSEKEGEEISATASTLVSGRELAIYMGLPKKSVSGIPVIECAAFGRNVLYTENKSSGKKIDLGYIHHMYDDEPSRVLLDKNSFTSHVFVTGSTGSGKSNTIYQLLDKLCFDLSKEAEKTNFMVIEPAKGEYRSVFGGYPNVQVFGTNPYQSKLLRINPFSFPYGIHVLEHIDRLIEIFNVCWAMYAAMPAVLKESIERAYEIAGWNLVTSRCKYQINGKNTYPNFIDVLDQVNEVINNSKYSSDSKGDYIGALSMRIGSLTNGINGLILTSDELTYEELFDRNVIVDLSRVGSVETKSLLMGLLIMKLQEYRMVSSKTTDNMLRHITILEEAHHLLKRTSTEQSQDSSNLVGKSVEMLASAIAEMRTYGEGFMIVDQSPGLMDMSVIRNTNTKIILRLPDVTDRQLVGRAANLNEDQIVELAKLRTGVCAVYQSNWTEPVLCHVQQWSGKKKKCDVKEEEDIFDPTEIKKQIIKLVLKPPHSIESEKIEEIFESLDKSPLSTGLKIKLIDLTQERNIEKFRTLRKEIVYEIFDPDKILEKNIHFRNQMKEWCVAMQEELVPNLNEFEDDEIRKILALLAFEKTRVESKREYEELMKNLLIFMDKGRGKI